MAVGCRSKFRFVAARPIQCGWHSSLELCLIGGVRGERMGVDPSGRPTSHGCQQPPRGSRSVGWGWKGDPRPSPSTVPPHPNHEGPRGCSCPCNESTSAQSSVGRPRRDSMRHPYGLDSPSHTIGSQDLLGKSLHAKKLEAKNDDGPRLETHGP